MKLLKKGINKIIALSAIALSTCIFKCFYVVAYSTQSQSCNLLWTKKGLSRKKIPCTDFYTSLNSSNRILNQKICPRKGVDSLWSSCSAEFSVERCYPEIATWNILMMQEAYINSTSHNIFLGNGLHISPLERIVHRKSPLTEKNEEEVPPAKQISSEKFPTDVNALRNLFGLNRNSLWGDLDSPTSRRLYQALLPRTLLRLHREGLAAEELAPLAYEVRVAAKVYARERCRVPGRILAVAYDGFRHLWKYGFWSSKGLSWLELWDKYEMQIKEEVSEIDPSATQEDFTVKICLRILERSCVTNAGVDWLLLSEAFVNDEIARLDKEVEDILQEKKGNI